MYYHDRKHNFAENTNNLSVDISELGYVRLGTSWRQQNVCSGFTRIYMMTAGSAVIQNEEEEITMLPGNIYIVPAGMKFSYRCDNYYEKLYFHINVLKPDKFDLFSGFNSFITISECEKLINEIVVATEKNSFKNFIFVKSKIYDIINVCMDVIDENNNDFVAYSLLVRSAVSYINDNLSANLTIDEIAAATFVSPSKLQKKFRAEIGIPIGRYIHDRIMFKAERELHRKEKSLKEISESLGFCDQFYFSRCFVQKYGISPLKFRNNIE